jgi:hypothetical protein
MPLIFLGMDLVPWSAGPVVIAAAVLAACGVAGAAVGAVHGWYLQRMLPGPGVERGRA